MRGKPVVTVTAWTVRGRERFRLGPVGRGDVDGHYAWSVQPGPVHLDPVAEDLLALARAVHLADRAFRRAWDLGARRRCIQVTVHVHDPDLWGTATPLVRDLAGFASFDDWRVEWRRRPVESGDTAAVRERPVRDTVALFSGGLDSLCGAAVLARDCQSPLIVCHSPPGRERMLELLGRVWGAFDRGEFPPRDCVTFRLEVRERDASGRRSMFSEPSRRTRPFFFLALAAAVAVDAGASVIRMSENGALALSLPARADVHGACIARQAHARLLHGFGRLLDAIAPRRRPWQVFNPFARLTKGQCCNLLGPAAHLAAETLSCEYVGRQAAVVRSWKSRHPRRAGKLGDGPQCGLCQPCLARRAALHAAGILDPDRGYFFRARSADQPGAAARLFGRATPPLFRATVPHVANLRQLAHWLLANNEQAFAVRYLPELRALPLPGEPGALTLSECHRLMRHYAREILAFLEPGHGA
jgi:7-cyano-7-deazaguanine synthase in queuosine biosynthesis